MTIQFHLWSSLGFSNVFIVFVEFLYKNNSFNDNLGKLRGSHNYYSVIIKTNSPKQCCNIFLFCYVHSTVQVDHLCLTGL